MTSTFGVVSVDGIITLRKGTLVGERVVMGFDETDYVYKIRVAGTDIQEYYDLEHRLPESEVRDLWLQDGASKHGSYLNSVFEGNIKVELLTDEDETDDRVRFKGRPIPLPPPEGNNG